MRDRIMLNDGKYVHVWQKYKPAIVSLMIASAKEVQQYKLSQHEFVDISPKKATGYAFVLRIHKGKMINDVKKSLLAPDLLYVLKHSGKALDLSETAVYEFELDKDFTLHIRSEAAPAEDTETATNSDVVKEESVREEEVTAEVAQEEAAPVSAEETTEEEAISEDDSEKVEEEQDKK